MTTTQQLNDGVPVNRYEYDDAVVLAADLGVTEGSVDVVGDTVIVVADHEQYDLAVPDGDEPRAFINNGVLTVEVSR